MEDQITNGIPPKNESNMGKPSISVIMPVHNAGDSLERSIRSALSQKDVSLELICVDDGSEDMSPQLLRVLASEDGRIKIISQSNAGSGAARNRGLYAAKGEWIAFLDADDSYPTPYALSILVKVARNCGSNVAGGNMDRYNENGTFRDHYLEERFFADGSTSYVDFQGLWFFQRYVFRRDLLIENDISFPDYLRFQDPPFLVRTLLAAGKIATTSETVYCYTCAPGHVKWNSRKLTDAYKGMRDVLCISEENDLKRLHSAVSRTICNEEQLCMALLQEEDAALDALWAAVLSVNEKLLDDPENHKHFVAELENLVELRRLDRAKSDREAAHRLKCIKFQGGGQEDSLELSSRRDAANQRESRLSSVDAPKVSVIVPVYNAERYLEETLSSLQRQTLSEIEIICVDDGSTDGSVEIIARRASEDHRIRCIYQDNSGAGSARNRGFKEAQAPFVAFLDADDNFLPEFLESMWLSAVANSADVCICESDMIDEETGFIRQNARFPEGLAGQVVSPKEMGVGLFCICGNAAWNKLFRTSFIRELGIEFQTLNNANDLFFVCAAIAGAQVLSFVGNPFVQYRVGIGSSLQDRASKDPLCSFYAVSTLYEWLENQKKLKGDMAASVLDLTLRTALGALSNTSTNKAAFERVHNAFFGMLTSKWGGCDTNEQQLGFKRRFQFWLLTKYSTEQLWWAYRPYAKGRTHAFKDKVLFRMRILVAFLVCFGRKKSKHT